ncbi:MAG: Processive diacylglycerol beta-glucosyltransferase [Chlamydiia bacterium]|nr:Processive diacylglycerol beta-glucosyltransferase [Chlamydiia bacterium]
MFKKLFCFGSLISVCLSIKLQIKFLYVTLEFYMQRVTDLLREVDVFRPFISTRAMTVRPPRTPLLCAESLPPVKAKGQFEVDKLLLEEFHKATSSITASVPSVRALRLATAIEQLGRFAISDMVLLKEALVYVHTEEGQWFFNQLMMNMIRSSGDEGLAGLIESIPCMGVEDILKAVRINIEQASHNFCFIGLDPLRANMDELEAAIDADARHALLESAFELLSNIDSTDPRFIALSSSLRSGDFEGFQMAFASLLDSSAEAYRESEEYVPMTRAQEFSVRIKNYPLVGSGASGSIFAFAHEAICADKHVLSVARNLHHDVEALSHIEEAGIYEARVGAVFSFAARFFDQVKASTRLTSNIRQSQPIGLLTRTFRDANTQLSQKLDGCVHKFCGCNLSEDRRWHTAQNSYLGHVKVEVVDTKYLGRSALAFNLRVGSGHTAATEGQIRQFGGHGGCIYVRDTPTDIYPDQDVFRAFGDAIGHEVLGPLIRKKDFTALSLIQYCCENEAYGACSFVKAQALVGGFSKGEVEHRIGLALGQILACGRVDEPMSMFSFYSEHFSEAARRANVGLVEFSTDLSPERSDRLLNEGPSKNPGYILGSMQPAQSDAPCFRRTVVPETTMGERLGARLGLTTLPEAREVKTVNFESVVVTGAPVRPAFEKRYSPEELSALRERWNIGPDEQVVMICSGGFGESTNYIDQIALAHAEKGVAAPKVHYIQICGRNVAEKERLEAGIEVLKAPNASFQVWGYTSADDMAGLYQLAHSTVDVSGEKRAGLMLSTKSGGGTTGEVLVTGTRIVTSGNPPFSWEKENLEVMEGYGLATTFNAPEEMIPQLFATLEAELPQGYDTPPLDATQFARASGEISDRLIEYADRTSQAALDQLLGLTG